MTSVKQFHHQINPSGNNLIHNTHIFSSIILLDFLHEKLHINRKSKNDLIQKGISIQTSFWTFFMNEIISEYHFLPAVTEMKGPSTYPVPSIGYIVGFIVGLPTSMKWLLPTILRKG